jgi:hypothetical protein
MKSSNLHSRRIGLIFLIAFISLYSQYPGLYGVNGLLPIQDYFTRLQIHFSSTFDSFPFSLSSVLEKYLTFPSLLLFSSYLNVRADVFGEFLILLGILYSTVIALSGHQNSFLFFVIWICYLSLFLFGQVFLGFQWDILLLEVGFLAFISSLFRPFGPAAAAGGYKHFNWCYRFLIWKLMFMAGVVKLQANCPTWLKLTALEVRSSFPLITHPLPPQYHFATQCLPTPLAWFFHQFHPLFLRVGVVFTLLVEIPFTFFLLAPFSFTRRLGALFQCLLQIFIIFTGNYNFFNLLTLVLLLPVCYHDFPSSVNLDQTIEQPSTSTKKQQSGWDILGLYSFLITLCFSLSFHSDSHDHPLSLSRLDWRAQLTLILFYCCYSSWTMFEISLASHPSHLFIDRIVIQIRPTFNIDDYVTFASLLALRETSPSLTLSHSVTNSLSLRDMSHLHCPSSSLGFIRIQKIFLQIFHNFSNSLSLIQFLVLPSFSSHCSLLSPTLLSSSLWHTSQHEPLSPFTGHPFQSLQICLESSSRLWLWSLSEYDWCWSITNRLLLFPIL